MSEGKKEKRQCQRRVFKRLIRGSYVSLNAALSDQVQTVRGIKTMVAPKYFACAYQLWLLLQVCDERRAQYGSVVVW